MSEVFFSLMLVNLLGILSPGPDMMMIIRYGSSTAKRITLMCLLGIMTGLSVHVMLALFGISMLISQEPVIFASIKYIGAAYLIYIGIKSWRSGKQALTDEKKSSPKKRHAFLEGLLCNLLNPKVLMFVMAIFTQIVSPDTPTESKLIYAATLLLQSLVIWALLVQLICSGGLKSWLEKHQGKVNKVAGSVLIALGSLVGLQLS